MNAPWNSGPGGNRDPFAAYVCDDNTLDTLRPVVAELGWAPCGPAARPCRPWPRGRSASDSYSSTPFPTSPALIFANFYKLAKFAEKSQLHSISNLSI